MGVPASDVSLIANCKGTCKQKYPFISRNEACETTDASEVACAQKANKAFASQQGWRIVPNMVACFRCIAAVANRNMGNDCVGSTYMHTCSAHGMPTQIDALPNMPCGGICNCNSVQEY